MGANDDVIRALKFGRTAEYNAIIAKPSYQAELTRVRRDYNEKTWIDFSGFFPKFTNAAFEQRRISYQAKYGTSINIPGFADVIHITPAAKISSAERAAHLWATKRGLPSPLAPNQLQALKWKKYKFLKALASPTPAWMKNIGAVGTLLDNIEDALVTIQVAGRIAVKLAPRLLGRMIPGLGWVLLGADILNLANIASYVTFTAKASKRNVSTMAERNPFHAKAAANRASRLTKTLPGFGETLEILQTTDQLFGVGLCLGGFMGLITDTISKLVYENPLAQAVLLPTTPQTIQFKTWTAPDWKNDIGNFSKGLASIFINASTDIANLSNKAADVADSITQYYRSSRDIAIDKLKSLPTAAMKAYTDGLFGSMLISTDKDAFPDSEHTKAFIMLDTNIKGIMAWWIQNQPLELFRDIETFQFPIPKPSDPFTIDILDQHDPAWRTKHAWPHLAKKTVTLREATLTYAPKIKDSFQTYALTHRHEYAGMIAGQQVVEFTKDLIRSLSDDNTVKLGKTAWWSVAEDMARDIYTIPPDTPQPVLDQLTNYISAAERKTATPPLMKDVAAFGTSIGIDWIRNFPRRALDLAAENFPDWQTIENQIGKIFTWNP